jgi:uncharacterized protein YidB (DUF937 family)
MGLPASAGLSSLSVAWVSETTNHPISSAEISRGEDVNGNGA